MFEQELDRVRKRLRQQLDTRQPHTSLSSILGNEAIDVSYRAFFAAEVEWWLHEERAIRASNPRFDTSAEEMRPLFRDLDRLYVQNARFDHEELTATIDAAVKTRINFLCRPRTTLKWFVFRGEPTKTLGEVLLRLRYLTDHAYLTNGIREWASTRPPETGSHEILSVVEFERIVEKIDNDAILDLSQEEFVRLLDGLYAFFADADPNLPPESVPTEAVIIFLDDKGAIPISQALERLLYREELRTLTRSKLIDVIDAVIAGIEGQPGTQQPAQSNQPPAPPATEEHIEPEPEAAAPAATATTVVAPFEEAEQPALADAEAEPVETGSAQNRYAKFNTLVDQSTRERIIKKIFDKEQTLFEAVVADLLAHAQWKEAAGALDRFLAQRGVSPDSAPAMELTQALHRSFV